MAAISGVRIKSETSSPLREEQMPSTEMTAFSAIEPTTTGAVGSTLSRRVCKATQRYIAPVSRYGRPEASATNFAMVDFPAPAGPSIAMTVNCYQLVPRGRPSSYPAELCTPTTARSWNSSKLAAPAYVHDERRPATI